MKQPLFIAFSTQKGGVGKTTFTTLAASCLHYNLGYNVAVMDCDYPQWSIHAMRKREAEQLQTNGFYQKKAVSLFEELGKGTVSGNMYPSRQRCPCKGKRVFGIRTNGL